MIEPLQPAINCSLAPALVMPPALQVPPTTKEMVPPVTLLEPAREAGAPLLAAPAVCRVPVALVMGVAPLLAPIPPIPLIPPVLSTAAEFVFRARAGTKQPSNDPAIGTHPSMKTPALAVNLPQQRPHGRRHVGRK